MSKVHVVFIPMILGVGLPLSLSWTRLVTTALGVQQMSKAKQVQIFHNLTQEF